MSNENHYLKRGNLLWEGMRMMLPEHKEALVRQEKDQWKVDLHGELDEEQWWTMGEIIMDALKHALLVNLVYWEDGFYVEKECYIYKVDHEGKKIRIEYGPEYDSERKWIKMRVIYNVLRV